MCLRVWFSQTPGSLSFEGISFQNTRDFLGVSFHNTWKSWVLFIQLQNKDARRPEPVAGTTDVPNSIFELTFAVFRFPVSFWSVLGWFCYPVLTLIITSFDLSLTYWVWDACGYFLAENPFLTLRALHASSWELFLRFTPLTSSNLSPWWIEPSL